MLTRLGRLVWCAAIALSAAAASAQPASLSYQTVVAPDGVPLNVVDVGPKDAPGILFIHGVGQSHRSWDRQLKSDLAANYHLVAFDLRGHAMSGKPWDKRSYNQVCTWADDVAAVIRATGLTRPIIVVWSFGGTAGMNYVRCQGSEKISGLVFVASRAGLYPNAAPDPRIPAASSKMEEPDLDENLAGADAFTTYLTARPLPDALHGEVRMMNLMYPPYARLANEGDKFLPDGKVYKNNEDLIPKLTMPLFFGFGEHDIFSPAKAGETAIKTRFPTADRKTYAGAGHWVSYEAADEFNRDLAAFASRAFAKQ